MIHKLNFDNVSPFRKVSAQKSSAYSGSKTSREYDNDQKNQAQKSARNLPQQSIQIYSHSNIQSNTNNYNNLINNNNVSNSNNNNVLSSSTRLNSMPANQTPKKDHQYHMNQNQNQLSNYYCKTHENIAPSPHQRSTTMINIKQKENIISESKVDDLRKLKNEIESFKQREIKYLVRITTLEKEIKKATDQCCKVDQENKLIRNEFINIQQKTKRSTTPHKRDELSCSVNFSNSMGTSSNNNNNNLNNNILNCNPNTQKVDKSVQVSTQSKSEQQIAILEEYTKLLKKKLKEFEQSGHKKNASQCGTQHYDQKLRQNYENLKKQFKEIVSRYYQCEKDSFEIKSECKFLKDCLKSRQLYSSRSTQSSEQKLTQSVSKNFLTLTECEDGVPSVIKALNLPNLIQY